MSGLACLKFSRADQRKLADAARAMPAGGGETLHGKGPESGPECGKETGNWPQANEE